MKPKLRLVVDAQQSKEETIVGYNIIGVTLEYNSGSNSWETMVNGVRYVVTEEK